MEEQKSRNDLENVRLFSKTHDFKYYDKLSAKTKVIFLASVTATEEKLGHPTPITTIIKNHYRYRKEDFPKIGRVIGPASMYKLVWKRGAFESSNQ
jgi:hypothetical protein